MNEHFRDMYRRTRPDEKTMTELRERLAKEKNHALRIRYPLAAAACIALAFSCFAALQNEDITEYENMGSGIYEETDIIPESETALTEPTDEIPGNEAAASSVTWVTDIPDLSEQTEISSSVTWVTDIPDISEQTEISSSVISETEITRSSAAEPESTTEPLQTSDTATADTDNSVISSSENSLGELMGLLGYDGGTLTFKIDINDGSKLKDYDYENHAPYADENEPWSMTFAIGATYDDILKLLSEYSDNSPTEDFDFDEYTPGTEYARFDYTASDGRQVRILIDSERGIYVLLPKRPEREAFCYGFDSSGLFEKCIAYTAELCDR